MNIIDNTAMEKQYNVFDISTRMNNEIQVSSVKRKRKGRNLVARISNEVAKSHSADSFRNKEQINDIILGLLLNGQIYKANLFVFNCNTGFRNGDTMSLRVKDLIQPDGNIKDYITLGEDKTDNKRTIWLNDTVKKMLDYVIRVKKLTSDNYIFRGDGNKKSWVERIVFDEEGEVIECTTTFEKYNEYGFEREIAPMLVGSVTKWLKKLCKENGLDGKFSSHTFRQTYAYFISQGWTDNRYAMAACQDFGHSSLNVTLAHYMGVNPQELKQHQLALNLGKEAVDLFLENG